MLSLEFYTLNELQNRSIVFYIPTRRKHRIKHTQVYKRSIFDLCFVE